MLDSCFGAPTNLSIVYLKPIALKHSVIFELIIIISRLCWPMSTNIRVSLLYGRFTRHLSLYSSHYYGHQKRSGTFSMLMYFI